MDKKKLREYVTTASIRVPNDEEYEEISNNPDVRNFRLAVGPVDGDKPRILLISAWMAHEGRNDNGDAFVKEELEQVVVRGLFEPPHAGMIDFNHDFTARGLWYKSSFAFDAKAGLWGIVAHGTIWAWRFSELADGLLAEMQRENQIPVSMSAVPESIEFTTEFPGAEGKSTAILHNPVFFTTSILDVPPADENARGIVSEETDNSLPVPASKELRAASSTNNGDQVMDEKVLKQLTDDASAAREDAKAAREEATASKTEAVQTSAELSKTKESLESMTAERDELKTTSGTLTTKVAELEVAVESAATVKADLESKFATATEELNALRAEKAASEKAELIKARIAELPEIVQENIDKHADRDAVIASWTDMSDEEWTVVKTSFALAGDNETGYVGRSKSQGRLPAGSAGSSGSSLSKYIL